jgi:cysteine-rich repeat protein
MHGRIVKRTGSALGSLALVLAFCQPCLAQTCGDGATSGGEACDDANTSGGDGCAANCTLERDLTCGLAQGSTSTARTEVFSIPTNLTGQVVLTVGGMRPDAPTAPVPFVIRAANAQIAPVSLPGLGTSCTAVGEIPGWGPGNAGGGFIDCGSTRLSGIDVTVTLDHADPQPTPVAEHRGMGPAGSVTFDLGMTNYTLTLAGGGCALTPGTGPPPFGPDAIPCTPDDPSRIPAQPFYGSSGQATARVLNANGGSKTIQTTASGGPIDCAQLDGASPLSGAALVAVVPALGLPQLGDATITVTLVCAATAPVATPTPHFFPTCVPTPTWTPTPTLGDTPSPVPTGTATPLPTQPATPASASATATSEPTAPAPTSSAPPHTATPTAAEATATPTGATAACAGDCNGDGMVTVDELVRAVNIALGSAALGLCPGIDGNADGSAGIDELIRAVNNALQSCPR